MTRPMTLARASFAVSIAVLAMTFAPRAIAADTPSADDSKESENRSELFDRLDANDDGQLTADEATDEHRRLFERLTRRADKDGDGKISRDEFTAAASEGPEGRGGRGGDGGDGGRGGRGGAGGAGGEGRGGRGGPPRGPGMGGLMRSLDADQDGKLNASEINQAVDALKKLDKNGDGELTREELMPPGMGSFGRGGDRPEFNPEAMADSILTRRDKNGDGKLQKDEVGERMAERFDNIDTNQDGALDKAELGHAMERRGGPSGPGRERPDRPGRPDGPDGRPGAPEGRGGRPDRPPPEGRPDRPDNK